MSNTVFELKIGNDRRIISNTASFIADSASKLGLSAQKVRFLCFTIETVLDYRMAALDDSNKEISLVVEDNGSYFKFSVTDLGRPYILTENQQKILRRKLVDRYSFEQRGRRGQCFSFIYRYDGAVNKPDFKSQGPEVGLLLDDNFTFRALKGTDEDILEVINCLYDSYGYDYYHQHLYSVESFKKYMEGGRYVPILCENDHHQVICYCALDENAWFAGVPEYANLVTKPVARGQGIASKTCDETERIAREMNYEGIHASAVAYHPYSQMMCNKHGYTPTAIEYSIEPAGTGGYGDGNRRLDCVIAEKIFNKERQHELYLDESCNEFFAEIFRQLGLKYTIHNGCELPADESLVSYFVDTDSGNCFAKIDQCGEDISTELKKIFDSEEVQSCDAVTVNLNMNTPGSVLAFRAMKDFGFICTGCIPGCLNGDFMLMQNFKVQPEYDKTVLEPNFRELAEKVYTLNGINQKSIDVISLRTS